MKEIFKIQSPVFGFSRLCFGKDTQTLGEDSKQYSFYIKFSGREPKLAGEELKVFTFGLFMVKHNHHVRAGFVKRHQTLLKA